MEQLDLKHQKFYEDMQLLKDTFFNGKFDF